MDLNDDAIKCPECGMKCMPAKINVAGADVKGWRCNCGYELINPEEIDRAYDLLQDKT
jgi:hypothetical protein